MTVSPITMSNDVFPNKLIKFCISRAPINYFFIQNLQACLLKHESCQDIFEFFTDEIDVLLKKRTSLECFFDCDFEIGLKILPLKLSWKVNVCLLSSNSCLRY